MGQWVYGCDVCQLVCPLNQHKWQNLERAYWLEKAAPHLRPDALAQMSNATYHDIVHPLFFYIPKDDIARWHRNARRAAAHRLTL